MDKILIVNYNYLIIDKLKCLKYEYNFDYIRQEDIVIIKGYKRDIEKIEKALHNIQK